MSSSVHVDNKGKDILVIFEGPGQGLDDTTLIAETKYPINFTKSRKNFAKAKLKWKQQFLFYTKKIYQFKTKNSEMKYYALCLGNVLDFAINKT